MTQPIANLGCNYKALQANWPADAAYFKSIGLTSIRPNLAGLPNGWTPPGPISAGSYETWRNCAIYFTSLGFWVSWGASGPNASPITATVWSQYAASVLADAAYMQAQGIAIGAYELGNEMEGRVDGTTLTIAQLIANIGTLATQVKAVYTLSPISYSCYDAGGITYNTWVSTGMGGLDYLGLHPYSNINSSGRGLTIGGYQSLQYPTDSKIIYHFGTSKCYVSEFGLEANNTNLNLMPKYLQVAYMRDRWAYLKNLGLPKCQVYTYVGFLNADNQFAMKDTNGQYEPMWNVLVQNGGRTSSVNFA